MDLMLTGDKNIDKCLINLDKRISNLNIPGAPVINIYDPLAITADYTFVNTDLVNIVYVTTGAGNITVTVPSDINRQVSVMKIDSGAGKVIVSGSINGVSSIDVELQYRGISVASTGAALVITGTIGECEIQTIGSAIELVYTKYYTGNTVSDSVTLITADFADKTKIVGIRCFITNDDGDVYSFYPVAGGELFFRFRDSAIDQVNVSSQWHGNVYRYFIKYYI